MFGYYSIKKDWSFENISISSILVKYFEDKALLYD